MKRNMDKLQAKPEGYSCVTVMIMVFGWSKRTIVSDLWRPVGCWLCPTLTKTKPEAELQKGGLIFFDESKSLKKYWATQGKRREGNGNPLQYSCLENPMDWRAWKATVHGVAESQTQLSDLTFTFHFPAVEKEMATHSSVLAWRIPGTAEPGGLLSMGSHRVRHDWSDLVAAAAARKETVRERDVNGFS